MIKLIKAIVVTAWAIVTIALMLIMLMLMFGIFQEVILWILK